MYAMDDKPKDPFMEELVVLRSLINRLRIGRMRAGRVEMVRHGWIAVKNYVKRVEEGKPANAFTCTFTGGKG